MDPPPPMHPRILADLLAEAEKHGKPDSILMGSWDYAGVRKFGRDHLDINTDWSTVKGGLMSTIWGKNIWLKRTSFCSIQDKGGKILVHSPYPDGPIHQGPSDSCDVSECILQYVMDQ